jgi:hypothetical protein
MTVAVFARPGRLRALTATALLLCCLTIDRTTDLTRLKPRLRELAHGVHYNAQLPLLALCLAYTTAASPLDSFTLRSLCQGSMVRFAKT